MSYDLVTGDTGSKLVVTVKDSATGSAVNLTGATVRFRWEGETAMVTVTATIINAAAGICEYQFLAGQIIAPAMLVEVEVTDGSGKVTTGTELIELRVREQLG